MNPVLALNITAQGSRGDLKKALGRGMNAIWRALERVGQRRAAAEMERQADRFRVIDAERAVFFERLAADCRRASSGV